MKYGITIVIIAFLAIVGTIVLFSGGDSNTSTNTSRNTVLADYDDKDTASVSWTQQGRLVGEDQRNAIRITVTRNKRTIEILSGYSKRVDRSAEFVNSPEAFEAFVRALDNSSFGRERTATNPDDRGMCPTGYVYIYRFTDMGSEIMRTWSGSCTRSDGTFGGGRTAPLIAKLFKAQITDYSAFVKGVKL